MKENIPPHIPNYKEGPSEIPRRAKKLNKSRSNANNKDNSALRAKLHQEKRRDDHHTRNAVQLRIDAISNKGKEST